MSENNNQSETEEFEEQEEENLNVAKERKIKRVNLDEEDTLTKTIFGLPKSDLKKLSHESAEKEISKGAILRKLVREHLTKEEKPTQPNPEATIPDEELEEFLSEFQTYEGGFRLTGDGFFTSFANRGWKLKDLTDQQFLAVCTYLQVGLDGFFFAPSVEEFMGWIKEIEPSDEQVEILTLNLTHGITYTEEDTKKTIKELIAEIKTQVGIEESEPSESSEEWKNVPVKE